MKLVYIIILLCCIFFTFSCGEQQTTQYNPVEHPIPANCNFFGDIRNNTYHLPGCPKLPPPQYSVCFGTEIEAENAGFHRCKYCFR